MSQDPIDDTITLAGQVFPVKGNLQANAASEFETGIKVGPPSNDHREHAFFLGINDFSGGFGTRRVDIREEMGNFWYPEDNSPETAFAGRITLPIKQELVTIGTAPSTGVPYQVSKPWCQTFAYGWYFGLGSAIYNIVSESTIHTAFRMHDRGAGSEVGCVSRLEFVVTRLQDNGSGTRSFDRRIYAAYDSPVYWNTGGAIPFDLSLNEGNTWTIAPGQIWYTGSRADTVSQLSINWVYKKIQPLSGGTATGPLGGPGGGGVGALRGAGGEDFYEILIPTYNGGYRPLDFGTGEFTPPAGFTEGSPHPLFRPLERRTGAGDLAVTDLLYWDKKLLGTWNGQVFFLVPRRYFNHREEIDWSFDDDGYITEYLGTRDPVHISGTTTAEVGNPGEEPWNVFFSEEDGESVGTTDTGLIAYFIGTAQGPSGEPLPYLRSGRKLNVLDFYARQMIPIEIGAASDLVSGVMVNGEVDVCDGWNVFAYNKGNVRNIGLPNKPGFGVPPNLLNGTGDGIQEIVNIFQSDNYVMAVVVDKSDTDHPSTSLYRHNGLGWHKVGKSIPDFWGQYGFQMHFGYKTTQEQHRYICIPGYVAPVPTPARDSLAHFVNDDPPVAYALFTLPSASHQSTVGRDTFGDSGAAMVTGWYDGGFLDIKGSLLRLNIDAWSLTLTETVKIEYRLDNDEDAAWTQLVDIDGNAAVFDSAHHTLYFPGNANAREGVEFRTVQFRIELTRGGDATRSPELRALTLTYIKTPNLRTSWVVPIDINRMIERGVGGDQTFWIDGAPATAESIWAKLRSLWNTKTLLSLSVSNVQDSMYVRLTDIPVSLDDIRTAVAGQGVVTIQLIEPVGIEDE